MLLGAEGRWECDNVTNWFVGEELHWSMYQPLISAVLTGAVCDLLCGKKVHPTPNETRQSKSFK